jgi:hypothetical protein
MDRSISASYEKLARRAEAAKAEAPAMAIGGG